MSYYLIDIVMTVIFEKHLRLLRIVFKFSRNAGSTVKLERSKVLRKEITCLCVMITLKIVKKDAEKSKAITSMPILRIVSRWQCSSEWLYDFLNLFLVFQSNIRNWIR